MAQPTPRRGACSRLRTKKHDGGWRRRASRYLYESQWFNLRQDDVDLPSGEPIVYTMVEHPGYSMIVPLLDDGRVLLERVYRYTVQETVLECPSGGIEDESPERAAHRELREETGWSAERMLALGSYFGSNGISDERVHFFLATGLAKTHTPTLEATEQISIELMPMDEAVGLARSGGIQDAPSALGLLLAEDALRKAG
jgi:ADP-ribose pyrophosphatase